MSPTAATSTTPAIPRSAQRARGIRARHTGLSDRGERVGEIVQGAAGARLTRASIWQARRGMRGGAAQPAAPKWRARGSRATSGAHAPKLSAIRRPS